MGVQYAYKGATGAIYNFDLIDAHAHKPLPWRGGLIIFSERPSEPLQIMSVSNLESAVANLQPNLAARPLVLIYVLVEDDATRRARIVADLRQTFPQMTTL